MVFVPNTSSLPHKLQLVCYQDCLKHFQPLKTLQLPRESYQSRAEGQKRIFPTSKHQTPKRPILGCICCIIYFPKASILLVWHHAHFPCSSPERKVFGKTILILFYKQKEEHRLRKQNEFKKVNKSYTIYCVKYF